MCRLWMKRNELAATGCACEKKKQTNMYSGFNWFKKNDNM